MTDWRKKMEGYIEYAEEENDYNEILIDLENFPVRTLANIGEPLVEPLIEHLLTHHLDLGYEWGQVHPSEVNWDYCKHAAKVLGKIGDKRAVKPLIEMLGEAEGAAVNALANIGKPAVGALIKALGTNDSEFKNGRDIRNYAVKALVKISEPSIKPLTKALERKNENVRKAAALALKKLGHDVE